MNSKARVLNVNADPVTLKLVSNLMRSAGYEIFEAASGLECLEIVKEKNPDIVLLDVVLPDIDGLEVCRCIKQNSELSDIIVIHLSAVRTSSENRAEGLENGADGYIKLPIDPRELVAEIQSLARIKETYLLVREQQARADIEEQARLQLRIRNAAMEWQKTFDAIESPVLILDSKGYLKRMNRAARDLSETTYHKCIGRAVDEISSGEPWRMIALAAMTVQTSQTAYSCQARDPLTGRSWDIDAALFISSSSKPGHDSERIIIVARDTTKIAQLQESLRRSETLSAIGSLTAAVAHEVRNPIFSIQATLDAFEARFGIKEEYKRHLGILRNEVSRLAQLMQDLLDYGKPPAPEFSEGSLADIVAQAINACCNAADRMRVAVVNDSREDLEPIRRDPERLFRALQNIIENSIQHSPPGAVVTVAVKPILFDNRLWLDCIVKDSGPGFKDADLPKVFEPFFSKRRGGIGLGLAIVQRIVEEHGGKVIAENRPEGGSMMTVRLPVA